MAIGNGFTEWNLYFRWSLNKRHLNHIRWTIFYFALHCSFHFSFPSQLLPADSDFSGWGGNFLKNIDHKFVTYVINGGLSSSPSEKVDDSEEERFSFILPSSPFSPSGCSTPPLHISFSHKPLPLSSFLLEIFFPILFSSVAWGKENATFVGGGKRRDGVPIWKSQTLPDNEERTHNIRRVTSAIRSLFRSYLICHGKPAMYPQKMGSLWKG